MAPLPVGDVLQDGATLHRAIGALELSLRTEQGRVLLRFLLRDFGSALLALGRRLGLCLGLLGQVVVLEVGGQPLGHRERSGTVRAATARVLLRRLHSRCPGVRGLQVDEQLVEAGEGGVGTGVAGVGLVVPEVLDQGRRDRGTDAVGRRPDPERESPTISVMGPAHVKARVGRGGEPFLAERTRVLGGGNNVVGLHFSIFRFR